MLGALIAGAITGGIALMLSRLLDDDSDAHRNTSALFCDLPATITHWQYFQNRWGCVITVSNLPGGFISYYRHKEVLITAKAFDSDTGTSIKTKKAEDGTISDAVLQPLLYTVTQDASYSVFLPYSETDADNVRHIQFKIVFFIHEEPVLQTAACFDWNIPQAYRVQTLQQVYLVCYAKIMDELLDFENDQWGYEYDELVQAICEDEDGSEDQDVRSYLETCFFDDIPADYEIAAALNGSGSAVREEIFTDLFEFYSFMKSNVTSIVAKSPVIARVAHSLGVTEESYYRITGFRRKNKKSTTENTQSTVHTAENPHIAAYLEILEIQYPLTAEKIKTAYRIKCKEFHPDQYQHLNKKMQDFAASELIKAQEARDLLMEYVGKA